MVRPLGTGRCERLRCIYAIEIGSEQTSGTRPVKPVLSVPVSWEPDLNARRLPKQTVLLAPSQVAGTGFGGAGVLLESESDARGNGGVDLTGRNTWRFLTIAIAGGVIAS